MNNILTIYILVSRGPHVSLSAIDIWLVLIRPEVADVPERGTPARHTGAGCLAALACVPLKADVDPLALRAGRVALGSRVQGLGLGGQLRLRFSPKERIPSGP